METQLNQNLLKNYLKNRIKVQGYFQVVEQIISMLKNSQGKGFTFALNLETMQILNDKVQFQMTAEDSLYEIPYVKNFLKELTFAAVFAPEEDCKTVTKFMKFLDEESQSASLDTILAYIETGQNLVRPSGQLYSQPQLQPSGQLYSQPQLQPSGQLYSQPQIQPSGQLYEQPRIRPYVQPEDGETGVLGAGFWENLESRYQNQMQNNYSGDETGVLEPSFWETALKNTPSTRLDNNRAGSIIYGRLIHVKSGKQTLINRDNFWIGKEDVDLQINKEVISRRHAVIISRANHYFISDNGSTNKTFVNNKEIPAKASVEIFAGTRIKFANEEYEFQL